MAYTKKKTLSKKDKKLQLLIKKYTELIKHLLINFINTHCTIKFYDKETEGD